MLKSRSTAGDNTSSPVFDPHLCIVEASATRLNELHSHAPCVARMILPTTCPPRSFPSHSLLEDGSVCRTGFLLKSKPKRQLYDCSPFSCSPSAAWRAFRSVILVVSGQRTHVRFAIINAELDRRIYVPIRLPSVMRSNLSSWLQVSWGARPESPGNC